MKESIERVLQQRFKATSVHNLEVIQTLWSGYGQIVRYALINSAIPSVIVKRIQLENQSKHPRGWNTDTSHLRKVKSYQVEQQWYEEWAKKCDNSCKVPLCYQSLRIEDEQYIIMEDLDAAGFSIRKTSLSKREVVLGVKWLANFHATFLNQTPKSLWKEGAYWHLATRADEFAAMKDGKLKQSAVQLDQLLSNCQFRTIIHGDAKVANFCFSEDMQQIAAVDFQYVGGGCGMKDLTYFLGSCLSEDECEKYETALLNEYFQSLKTAIQKRNLSIEFDDLEKEWRKMYSIAWADFTRFLLGWMPEHQKINGYSLKLVEQALMQL